MSKTVLSLTILLGVAFGVPTPGGDDHGSWHNSPGGHGHQGGGDSVPMYQPPGPNDVRSPCPLLNSLANEGILPRNGRNYTVPILTKAFKNYVNVGADVAQTVGAAGIALSPRPNSDSFDLDDLDKHNAIEHDGSISRNDFFFGDDHDFNMFIFSQAAAHFQKQTITIPDAAAARLTRMTISKRTNPEYSLSETAFMGSFTEQSFYLSVFGDPYTGVVPQSEWVRYWFEQQRLPYSLGWTPRALETNLTTLGAMAPKVMAATPSHTWQHGDHPFHFWPH